MRCHTGALCGCVFFIYRESGIKRFASSVSAIRRRQDSRPSEQQCIGTRVKSQFPIIIMSICNMRKFSFILHRILIFLFYNDRRAKKECLPKPRSEKKRNIYCAKGAFHTEKFQQRKTGVFKYENSYHNRLVQACGQRGGDLRGQPDAWVDRSRA